MKTQLNVSIESHIKKLLDEKCENEARDKSKVVERLLTKFINNEIKLEWNLRKNKKE